MKTQISIVLMTMIIVLMTSCTENGNDELYYSVDFTQIAQDNLYGAGEEHVDKQNLLISDSRSWNELMNRMNTINNVSDSFSETSIDFDNYMIVAVFDDMKSHGGHSIDITRIAENEDSTIITVKNKLTGNGTDIMTQPFHIVKIPKTDNLVTFRINDYDYSVNDKLPWE